MAMTLETLKQDAAADHAKVYNSIGHVHGIDPRHKCGRAVWVETDKGGHYKFSEPDKVAQRKIHDALVTIYEPLFADLGTSHGYRAGHSVETALAQLQLIANEIGGEVFVIKADIKDCFRSIDHYHLNRILDKRVTCGRVRRGINKFLRTRAYHPDIANHPVWIGDGYLPYCGQGIFRGSVLGPILANIFLHDVLDTWFAGEFPDLGYVRYADDFHIIGPKDFAGEAGVILGRVNERLGKFGLQIKDSKTQIKIPDSGKELETLGYLLQ